MRKGLITFIKNPELGKVKTRLAKSIGETNALMVYKQLLLKTKEVTAAVETDRFLFYSNQIDHSDDWSPKYFKKYLQVDGDLGEKMKRAFQQVFAAGNNPVVIIGSDCFDITSEIIESAFKSLDNNDVVIGPANDGGYYLLGMNKLYPEIFTGIEWSTDSVFERTINQVKQLNKKIYLLPELIDIDELSDLQASSFDSSGIVELKSRH
jgi:hypothetical protein